MTVLRHFREEITALGRLLHVSWNRLRFKDKDTQQFRVLVKKDHQVHLAQTYSYKSPLDVVYFLLKICYEFKLDQSSVFVILSGLIEKDSAMYRELHSYFVNLHFAEATSYELPQNELPHHYFTSLYNLAACAS